jgi:mannosyl-oligosaccharide alpha-1,2-mannosidase
MLIIMRTSSWVSQPKQEHLACFLAGSLMLGATTAHRLDSSSPISRPPRMDALTGAGQRDWATGVAFLEGCMDTHKTKTCVLLSFRFSLSRLL